MRLSEPPKRKPQVLLGPIAAGEQVLVSKESETYRLVRANYGDALAVEMEGYGFLKATHAYSNLEALVVRGISDPLEGKTEADESGSQEMASQHAAAFAFEVLAKLKLPSLNNELTSKTPALKVRLLPHDQFIDPNNQNKWVSVEVINEEDVDLTECHGTFEYVARISDSDPVQKEVIIQNEQEAWSHKSSPTSEGLATIYPDMRAYLDVARTRRAQNIVQFTTWRGDRFDQSPGIFHVRTKIGGKIRGRRFTPLLFDGYLHYRGGADLTIAQTIEQVLYFGIKNGGFEAGHTVDWTENPGNSILTDFAQVTPRNGQWLARLGGKRNSRDEISQVVHVPEITPIYLVYYCHIRSNATANLDDLLIFINKSKVVDKSLNNSADTMGQWKRASIDLSAFAGQTVTIRFRVVTGPSDDSTVYLDDVTFSFDLGEEG
jgi:hypothetical protein